jgi:Uma2 family endonuclease
MTAVPMSRLTATEYLAIERAAEFKGEMFAMAGASRAHSLVAGNLAAEMRDALKGGPCEVHGSDLRVKIDATGLYTYPDVTVACGELQFDDRRQDTLTNPTLIVEVLSDSTANYDRTTKFRHYRKIPSVREYVLASQSEPLVERFVRQADGSWALFTYEGMEATVAFAAVPVVVTMAEIYRRVEFPSAPPLHPARGD